VSRLFAQENPVNKKIYWEERSRMPKTCWNRLPVATQQKIRTTLSSVELSFSGNFMELMAEEGALRSGASQALTEAIAK
jgi:hypothetical protein